MAMKASYHTVCGVILAQETSGSRTDYLPDALGSVVSAVNRAKAVTRTARYNPYGSELSSLGAGLSFGWAGIRGYRETGLQGAGHSVRSRHYGAGEGRWRSVDPLWPPGERAYGYARGKVATYADPSGKAVVVDHGASPKLQGALKNCCGDLSNTMAPWPIDELANAIASCM